MLPTLTSLHLTLTREAACEANKVNSERWNCRPKGSDVFSPYLGMEHGWKCHKLFIKVWTCIIIFHPHFTHIWIYFSSFHHNILHGTQVPSWRVAPSATRFNWNGRVLSYPQLNTRPDHWKMENHLLSHLPTGWFPGGYRCAIELLAP